MTVQYASWTDELRAIDKHDHAVNKFAWKLSKQRKVVQLQSMTDFEDALQEIADAEATEFGIVREDADLVATYVEATPLDADTRNFYPEPDVTTVKPSSANIFWRTTAKGLGNCKHGSCSIIVDDPDFGVHAPICHNAYAATIRNEKPAWATRRQDVITTPAGHKLYPSWDKHGNKLLRYYINDDANITFRLSVRKHTGQSWDFPHHYYVEMFHNVRRTVGRQRKWVGRNLKSHSFDFPEFFTAGMDLAEQRATYWIMAQLAATL